jgi:hypothetical protein
VELLASGRSLMTIMIENSADQNSRKPCVISELALTKINVKLLTTALTEMEMAI